MAYPELIARLEHDAQARLDEVARAAREEIAQLEAQASQASAQRRDAELARRHAQRQAVLDRELAAARAAARGDVLRAREALVERIFERARALLPGELEKADVRAALVARAVASLGYLGAAPRARAPDALAESLTLAGFTVTLDTSLRTGAVLEAADGSVAIELTLDRELSTARPSLAMALAKELPS